MIFSFQCFLTRYKRLVKIGFNNIGLSILFLLSFQLLPAQEKHHLFSRIDISGGLSHSHVQCFLKDRKGFLWAGTFEGLNRFDGYSFKVFRNIPGDSSSLKDNLITRLFEDHYGKIWISSGLYFHIYDPEKETFVQCESLFDGRIPVPYGSLWYADYDARGDLIFANSRSGIYKYFVASDSVVKIKAFTPNTDSTIVWMKPDKEGNIWLSFRNSYLYKIDGQTFAVEDSVKMPSLLNNEYGFYIDDDNEYGYESIIDVEENNNISH